MENKENMKFDFVVTDETSDPPEVAIKVSMFVPAFISSHTCCVLGYVCTGLV